MAVKLSTKYADNFISDEALASMRAEAESAFEKVMTGSGDGSDYLGWRDLPLNYDREEFDRIKKAAEYIRANCDVFVVIGIGGSYLGARAAVEFVNSPFYNSLAKDGPAVYFAGNSISPTYLSEILDLCKDKDVCINVISKSGTTTEPALAFRVMRSFLENKYGIEESVKRIFVTTDKCRGTLKQFSTDMGYESFVVPDSIGGRYSVLTAVGLLPIAVAGIDIDAMMKGAADARAVYTTASIEENDAVKYAMIRNYFYRTGKKMEMLAAYDPALALFAEWWKQLYGESEGKDGKGIFPTSAMFSTDLHSLGQMIQQGERTLFETMVDIEKPDRDIPIESDPQNLDGMNFLAGKNMSEVNHTAFTATALAHNDGGVPNLIVSVPSRSAESFGALVYFFEFACGISAYLLGVNPFNQPGVEAYKTNMYALLGKPGYEALRAELESRLGK